MPSGDIAFGADPGPSVWALDLDGVMWRGVTPIPGSAAAVARLREAGHTVAFCTNNSSERVDAYVEKLARCGVPDVDPATVLTSALAAASLLVPGERVLLCAGDGAHRAAVDAGAEVIVAAEAVAAGRSVIGDVDTVMVGFHRHFDYGAMALAVRAVLDGARLVATNDDPIYPGTDGPAPGCGSILASIERGSGTAAVVAGKPNRPMAELIVSRWGAHGVFVGDSPGTDGAMAATLGWPFGLVLSGNIGPDRVPADQPSDWVAADLAALVDARL